MRRTGGIQRVTLGNNPRYSKNLVVRARAGTGKTFTIIGGIALAPETLIGYLVFGAKNRDEAVEKITDPRVTVLSLHQAGNRCIKRVWANARVDGNDANAVEYDRIEAACGGPVPTEVRAEIFKLVGFAKNTFCGIPSVAEVCDLANARDIECENYEQPEDGGWCVSRLAEIAVAVLEITTRPDPMGRISFNDMVWLPVAMAWVRPMFEFAVVDETQDMNAVQLAMVLKISSGRIAVVGDDRQAIYEFRGACQDGINDMKVRLEAAETGLTVTRRCARAIVAEAVAYVPDYRAADDAPEGTVDEIDENDFQFSARPGDAILSRTNAPLMSVCLSLIRKGIACRIEGRDIGAQLLGIIRKLKARSIPEVIRKAQAHAARAIARLGKMSEDAYQARVSAINDVTETIIASTGSRVYRKSRRGSRRFSRIAPTNAMQATTVLFAAQFTKQKVLSGTECLC